jgi:hypothetical protein
LDRHPEKVVGSSPADHLSLVPEACGSVSVCFVAYGALGNGRVSQLLKAYVHPVTCFTRDRCEARRCVLACEEISYLPEMTFVTEP